MLGVALGVGFFASGMGARAWDQVPVGGFAVDTDDLDAPDASVRVVLAEGGLP